MDGGIDLLYSRHFGWHVQERLQRLIVQRHHGELLVGTAEIVETDDSRIPYPISAPTMRVPMVLHNSVNPYLACRATLLLVKHGVFSAGSRKGEPVAFHVKSIAFHGLGTGVGPPPYLRASSTRCHRGDHAREDTIPSIMERSADATSATLRRRRS